MRLADFISAHGGDILAEWEDRVRGFAPAEGLGRRTLLDHIPDLLGRIGEMAAALASDDPPVLPHDLAETHALERLGEGFDLAQVTKEFTLLRDCILRQWCSHDMPDPAFDDVMMLNGAIDLAIAASIEKYTSARERTLRSLDRIAAAALESHDIDGFLQRLLAVLVETTESVDSAVIFLREGDILRARAAIGLDPVSSTGFTIRIGEGFAGTIASEQRPSLLPSVESEPLVPAEASLLSGMRAL